MNLTQSVVSTLSKGDILEKTFCSLQQNVGILIIAGVLYTRTNCGHLRWRDARRVMVCLFPCPPMPLYIGYPSETQDRRWTLLLQRFESVGSGAIAVSGNGLPGRCCHWGSSLCWNTGRLACTRKDCGCVNESSCRTSVIDFFPALSRYVHTEGS